MIRQAVEADIALLLELTRACAGHMIEQSIYQWNEVYPNEAAFLSDLNQNSLWVYALENNPVGCVSFYTEMDPEYKTMDWIVPESKHLYVHRLAVHPQHQGQNIARTLMDFAEDHARELGCASVRLDTFSQNPRNLKFYNNRGYQKTGGTLYFPKQSEHPFVALELPLSH